MHLIKRGCITYCRESHLFKFFCVLVQERNRLDRVLRKKQEERTAEFSRMQSKFRLEGDNKLILNLGWEELVQALQKRELTATSVLEAYTAKVRML